MHACATMLSCTQQACALKGIPARQEKCLKTISPTIHPRIRERLQGELLRRFCRVTYYFPTITASWAACTILESYRSISILTRNSLGTQTANTHSASVVTLRPWCNA